jgi:hypothetical protein
MCIEWNRDILFRRCGEKPRLTILRQLQRHATCPAKSYYTCHTGDSGFSSWRNNETVNCRLPAKTGAAA